MKKTTQFNLIIILLAISFIGCGPIDPDGIEPEDTTGEENTAEQAFEKVRQYFGNPETGFWNDGESVNDHVAFSIFEKNFTQQDLDNVLAYWENLPNDGTFYGGYWGPYNFGNIDWELEGLRFSLQLRYDKDNNRYLQLEIDYLEDLNRIIFGLSWVVPEKVLEITKGMIECVKYNAAVELAFESVRQYYGNPDTWFWNDGESVNDHVAFSIFEKNFTQQDLDKVLAYWDNLANDGSFYGGHWGPHNFGTINWNLEGLRFSLQLRYDPSNNRYLQLEIDYLEDVNRIIYGLSWVAPEKVLDIAVGMVESLGYDAAYYAVYNAAVEQAFEIVRQNFGNPEINSWYDDNSQTTKKEINIHVKKKSTKEDLDKVLAYWNSLPSDGTFYEQRWGTPNPEINYWNAGLRLNLELRSDYKNNKHLYLEIDCLENPSYNLDCLDWVVPEKVLEIAQGTVEHLGDNTAYYAAVEQAFESVWQYFEEPYMKDFVFEEFNIKEFNIHVKKSTQEDLNKVLAYWNSLPNDGTFFERRWDTPNPETNYWNADLRFNLQLRSDNKNNKHLYLEVDCLENKERISYNLDLVAPDMVLEIAIGMVNSVK